MAISRVVFRTDASANIGGGHVMRCLTLAAALAKRGAEVLFLTGAESKATVAALRGSPFLIGVADDDSSQWPAQIHEVWPSGADVAVVDHYGIDAVAEQSLRECARAIAVVDDLGNRPHDCDLLLDQTYGRRETDYRGLVPSHARVLTGAAYALLSPGFRHARLEALGRREAGPPVKRLLVSFGLVDVGALTLTAARALAGHGFLVDVTIASVAPALREIRAFASAHDDVCLHVDATNEDVQRLMAEADLAVGACGATAWERCCLGLPTIAVSAASNQDLVAKHLADVGAISLIAKAEELDGRLVYEAVQALVDDAARRLALTRAAAAVCDGDGTERVLTALAALTDAKVAATPSEIRIRRANTDDAVDIWLWRNRPEVQAYSLAPHAISWPEHLSWFARASDPDRSTLLICEAATRSVCHVRFERLPETLAFNVSIYVAPRLRARGLGKACLRYCVDWLHERIPKAAVQATIHRENRRSLRLFLGCGITFSDAGDQFLHARLSR